MFAAILCLTVLSHCVMVSHALVAFTKLQNAVNSPLLMSSLKHIEVTWNNNAYIASASRRCQKKEQSETPSQRNENKSSHIVHAPAPEESATANKRNANLLQFPAKSFASICSPTPPPRAMICCIFYELSPCHSAQLLQQVTGPIGRAAGRRRQCMGTTKLCMEKSNLRHHRELLQLVVAYRASRVGLGFVME